MEAMEALRGLYQEFGVAFSYGELAEDPKDHDKLTKIIASFGPMPCRIMPLTTEKIAGIIEDAIVGRISDKG